MTKILNRHKVTVKRMTLNLTKEDMDILDEIYKWSGQSISNVLKNSLRLFYNTERIHQLNKKTTEDTNESQHHV